MLLSLLAAAALGVAPILAPSVATFIGPVAPAADTLTADDLLDVATASVADLSDDGGWIALTVSRRRDALGVVAARTGDPTYIQQANVELIAMDSRTLARTPVFTGKRPVRGATWSPDGSRLAYLEVVNERFRLVVWERATGRTTVARLAPGTYVAETSELRWNGAGTALHFALRREAWRTEAQARFANLVTGPITHLNGQDKEPFLPWEALRREGNRRAIAAWTPATQRVEIVIAEGMIGNWQVSPDGAVRVWNDDVTKRTDYETIMGRSERLLARVAGDTADRVLMPTLRNTTVQWTEDTRRYFYARDGAIWMARVPGASAAPGAPAAPDAPVAGDTARRRIAAADSVPASDTTKAARDRRARTRWSLLRTAPRGDAVIASRMDGLYLIDTLGALTRMAAMPDSADQASARPSVLLWSHDGRWVYLAMNARDRWDRAIVRWDRRTGALDPLARDAQSRTGLALSKDASTLAFNLASANRPADPMVADASLGDVRRLHDANPHLTAARLARTELIRYLDVDGRPQWGVVYHPTTGARSAPTVFIVYEEFFDDTFDPQANYLASRGYAVVKPSVGFETGYPGEAWLKGVTAAANQVITMGIADSGRLAVQGQSYGGYAVNLIVTQTKRFKAAVNVSGKVDLISFYTDSPRLGDRNTHAAERSQDRIGATMWEAPMKYIEHSAVMFADRIATPVLLMTGGEDHNVPAINTREMYYALRRLGKPVEWVNYANGGHGVPMTEAREFTHYHETLAAWYASHLKPVAAPVVP